MTRMTYVQAREALACVREVLEQARDAHELTGEAVAQAIDLYIQAEAVLARAEKAPDKVRGRRRENAKAEGF